MTSTPWASGTPTSPRSPTARCGPCWPLPGQGRWRASTTRETSGSAEHLAEGHRQRGRPVGPLVGGARQVGAAPQRRGRPPAWRPPGRWARPRAGGGRPTTTSSTGASAPEAGQRQSRPRSRSRAASSGSMPAARWSAASSPDHTPATVGRSWVVTAARACARVLLGRGVLEPHEPVRQHARRRPAPSRTSGSTVPRSSPTTTAPGPHALDGQDGQQLVAPVADVGAVGGPAAGRDPEQAEQAHDVVDAQAAAAAAQRRAPEARRAGRSRRPAGFQGTNGGRPQSCPARLNSSGGAPTRTPWASRSCSTQASAPSGSTPMARSVSRGSGSSARCELVVEQELEPRPEAPPGRRGRRRTRPPPGRVGVAVLGSGQACQPVPWCSASAQKRA